jgi:hypothetical protein
MSEVKSEEKKAPESGPEELWGLREFALEVFPRLDSLISGAPWDFAQQITYNENIRVSDRVGLAFDLGAIYGLHLVLAAASQLLIGTDYLNKPEKLRQLAAIYNRLLETYIGYKRGNISNPVTLILTTLQARDSLMDFVKDFIKEIGAQK